MSKQPLKIKGGRVVHNFLDAGNLTKKEAAPPLSDINGLAGAFEKAVEKHQPLFQHDCEACVSLGDPFDGHDLYFCEQSGRPTIIARYGNEGREYSSGLGLRAHDKHIEEGAKRAEALGLIKPEPEEKP